VVFIVLAARAILRPHGGEVLADTLRFPRLIQQLFGADEARFAGVLNDERA
jgi:hypothetical protein